jgi:hypothetical protein
MASKSNIRTGSKVKFKVGRGELVGKVTKLVDGVASIKPDKGGAAVSRKLELLRAAKA